MSKSENDDKLIEELKSKLESLEVVLEYERIRAEIEEQKLKRLACITKIAQIKIQNDGASKSS